MYIKSNIWFENSKNGFFGKGRIELLEQINMHGSISAAAKAMKMSYKAAWDAVNEMNNLSEKPIVKRESGGKGGGGTVLTQNGHSTIALYRELEKMQKQFWHSIENITDNVTLLEKLSKTMTIRTSARNQLLGIVKQISKTSLEALVSLKISGGEVIKVSITRRSLEEMGISVGKELFIILKSSWLRLSNSSANTCINNLSCKIDKITNDSKITEVELRVFGGNTLILSLQTDKFNQLKLKEKSDAWIYFEPSNAILAI